MNSKIEKSNNTTRYFNIRDFEISKYRPFYIWSFQMLTPTRVRYEILLQKHPKLEFV